MAISVNNLNFFPTPVYFAPPLKGSPPAERKIHRNGKNLWLGIEYRLWRSKARMMGLPGRTRCLTISSAVWIQCTNVTDGRTDGRTPADRN